jgi:hypothetical protein
MFVKKPSVASEIIMQMREAASVSYDGLLLVPLVLIAIREYSLAFSSCSLQETAVRYFLPSASRQFPSLPTKGHALE